MILTEKEFSGRDLQDLDLTESDISDVVFKNVNFYNCTFDKTTCARTRFWCCFFDNCTFNNVDLRNTYLGAWGGGQNNCRFINCKLGKTYDASYIMNTEYRNCKIKGIEFNCFHIENVKFIGPIDDMVIRPLKTSEIRRYQSEETTNLVEAKIKKTIGRELENPKVTVKNIEFSGKLQFIDLSNCQISDITIPDDYEHLLLTDSAEIAKKVYEDIEMNWNTDARSWALSCTKNYFSKTTEIVSFYEFKCFEDEEFARKLIDLFRKHNR